MKRSLLDALAQARRAGRPAAIVTWLDSGRQCLAVAGDGPSLGDELDAALASALAGDRSLSLETGDGEVFIHVFNPPLRMVVVGAVHIAQALTPMALQMGYALTVIDPRRSFATAERFPGVEMDWDWPDDAMKRLAPDSRTAVITLTHDPKLDDPALHVALRSEAFYIGALGSRRTHQRRCERLLAAGFDDDQIGRIHAPVGLDLGGRAPAEIALATLAQVTGVLRGGKIQ